MDGKIIRKKKNIENTKTENKIEENKIKETEIECYCPNCKSKNTETIVDFYQNNKNDKSKSKIIKKIEPEKGSTIRLIIYILLVLLLLGIIGLSIYLCIYISFILPCELYYDCNNFITITLLISYILAVISIANIYKNLNLDLTNIIAEPIEKLLNIKSQEKFTPIIIPLQSYEAKIGENTTTISHHEYSSYKYENCYICKDCENIFFLEPNTEKDELEIKVEKEHINVNGETKLNLYLLKNKLYYYDLIEGELSTYTTGTIIEKKFLEFFSYSTKIPKYFYDKTELYKITSIAPLSKEMIMNLSILKLPNSIELIDSEAFKGNKFLKHVILSEGIKHIKKYAFANCENLISIRQPNSIANIDTIYIPNTVETIGEYAFADCKSIKNIVVPNSVKKIGENAFKGIDNVYYEGDLTGSPWGALGTNGILISKENTDKNKEEKKKKTIKNWVICLTTSLIVLIGIYIFLFSQRH